MNLEQNTMMPKIRSKWCHMTFFTQYSINHISKIKLTLYVRIEQIISILEYSFYFYGKIRTI